VDVLQGRKGRDSERASRLQRQLAVCGTPGPAGLPGRGLSSWPSSIIERDGNKGNAAGQAMLAPAASGRPVGPVVAATMATELRAGTRSAGDDVDGESMSNPERSPWAAFVGRLWARQSAQSLHELGTVAPAPNTNTMAWATSRAAAQRPSSLSLSSCSYMCPPFVLVDSEWVSTGANGTE
jgi:hypothetical protein